MEQLRGKNVLLIGAGGGIGSVTAKQLHASGAKLFLTGRNAAGLRQLAETLGIGADHVFAGDLSKPEQVQALAERYQAVMPVPDILINASGTGIIKPMEQLSHEEFMQMLQDNLYGPFLVLKAFLPGMKERKTGLIIHIPGVLGKVPMAGAAAYSASKYGLVGMLQSIREELKRTEVRITTVYMGGVDTPFWDTIDLRVQRDKMIREEEAARAIWFLCQQPASAVVSEMVLQPFNHQAI